MSDPFIGEIRLMANSYAPPDWLLCNGTQYSVGDFAALYSLIGTVYGGDGRSTFAVPNLKGFVVAAPDPTQRILPGVRQIGRAAGTATVQLDVPQVVGHAHTVSGYTVPAGDVINNAQEAVYLARSVGQFDFSSGTANVSMYFNNDAKTLPPPVIGYTGGDTTGVTQPHENCQPFLTLNYYICCEGIYPPRP